MAHDPAHGYRVEAPGHGLHLLSPDANELLLSLPAGPAWVWQRLLFAQTLPIAARLKGLTLLHASAVSLSRVQAMTGPSGTGKSSVALHLAGLGARFFSDDVVALEETAEGVLAHPGPELANVHAHELAKVSAGARQGLGREVGSSDRTHLEPSAERRSLPLGGLYFLRRTASVGRVLVEPVPAPDPVMLLGSGFLPQVSPAPQKITDLSVFTALASAHRTFEVTIPPNTTARDVAEALRSHQEGGR